MLKQQVSRINKILTILLVVLFVVSLTAAASSADPDHDQRSWKPRSSWKP